MIEFMLLMESGSFEFCAEHVSIGRDRRCTFVLPDISVQPLHVSLVQDVCGRLYIVKRHRDALTFVNRAPIHDRVQLHDGDLIDIGPWTLLIRSRDLPRRKNALSSADLSLELTPSDPAIVSKMRIPKPVHDDTSSSIIII